MSEEGPGNDYWKKNLKAMLSSRKTKWIILGCIIVVALITSTIMIYDYFAEKSLREKKDLEMLLDLLEKEVKEIEENRSIYGPPPPRVDVQDARILLDKARQHSRRGEYDLAWLNIKKLMFMLREYFLQPGINVIDEEAAMKCILLGKIERIKRWIDIFMELSEKTCDENVKDLLLNASNTLKQIVKEAEQLVEKGSYQEAKIKLDKAFKIINDILKSLKPNIPPPPPPREGIMRAPPHFSD